VVEDASRFARQLIVQEAGIIALIERGVRVLTSSGDDLTETNDPFKIAMRQIAGVFAQLEKARLVSKLMAARDRKRATGVKVEGRKSYAEIDAAEQWGRDDCPGSQAAAQIAQGGAVDHRGKSPPNWQRQALSAAADDRMPPPRSGAC